MRTIKISEPTYKYLKERAAKEGRFLWKILDDVMPIYKDMAKIKDMFGSDKEIQKMLAKGRAERKEAK